MIQGLLRRALGALRPRPRDRKLIVHCAHHRMGSEWFSSVLQTISSEYGLLFQSCAQEDLRHDTDVFLQNHSQVDLTRLRPYRGSHMIRDPRDAVVSGYFYHLWTAEAWAHIPRPKYGGRSYREHLNSLDREAGILEEIDRFAGYDLKPLADWDYADPDFLELRYEEVIRDEEGHFRRLFAHYGFAPAAVERAVEIAMGFSFERRSGRKIGDVRERSHLRSGCPGQWRDVLTDRQKARCREVFGDVLTQLGYESGRDW